MKKNNFILGLFVIVIYGTIFWLLDRLSMRMGEDAIYYEVGKNVLLIVFCLVPILVYFIKEFSKKATIKRGNEYNPVVELNQAYAEKKNEVVDELKRQIRSPRREKGLHISLSIGQWAIIASFFLLFAVGGLISCIRDLNVGEKSLVLQETQITYKSNNETGEYTNLKLQGVASPIIYDFPLSKLSADLIKLINTQHPNIVVTYYPNSEVLIQLDIYTADGVISVPDGSTPKDDNLSTNVTETLSNAQAAEPYEAVSLASLNLERYENVSGKLLSDVLEDISPLYNMGGMGFVLKYPGDDDYDTYESIIDELKEECEMNSSQECMILFDDDIALVIVYNIRSNLVEDMYAVKCLYLETNSF